MYTVTMLTSVIISVALVKSTASLVFKQSTISLDDSVEQLKCWANVLVYSLPVS